MSGSNGSGTATAWQLGTVSAHYEANGLNPGTVSSGLGDHGGASYGVYQLSSKAGTVKEYLSQSSYGPRFDGLEPATTPFNGRWKDVAHSDANFGPDQRDFIARTHFQPRVDELKADGVDLSGRGMAVQEALWSTSVQYRGMTTHVFEGALQEKFGLNYKANLDKLSDKDIVSAVQDYKLEHVEQNFHSSSAQVRDVIRSRIPREKEDLIALSEGRTPDYGHSSQVASTLREGSRGDGVSALQGQLNQLGYTDDQNRALSTDGHFGRSTRQAVQAFQSDEGLTADGIVGRGTKRLIDLAAGQQQAPQQTPNGAAPSTVPAGAAPTSSASGPSSPVPRISLHPDPDGEGAAAYNPWSRMADIGVRYWSNRLGPPTSRSRNHKEPASGGGCEGPTLERLRSHPGPWNTDQSTAAASSIRGLLHPLRSRPAANAHATGRGVGTDDRLASHRCGGD